MPLLALLALFVALPLAELFVILQVGDLLGNVLGSNVLGALATIALLAADSVIGASLLRSQGRAVWRRFNEAITAGRMPHREIQDGVAVIFGGAFLITPGFLTDIAGVALMLPPSRALITRYAARRIAQHAAVKVTATGKPPSDARQEHDVEGEATEYGQPTEADLATTPPQIER